MKTNVGKRPLNFLFRHFRLTCDMANMTQLLGDPVFHFHIKIDGPEVYVQLEVPFIFRIFRGRALEVIDREVRLWIEKAKNGELD